jgi:hypothetical protein
MPTQQEIEAQKAGTPSFPYKNQAISSPIIPSIGTGASSSDIASSSVYKTTEVPKIPTIKSAAQSPSASGLTQYASRQGMTGEPPVGYTWNADKTNIIKQPVTQQAITPKVTAPAPIATTTPTTPAAITPAPTTPTTPSVGNVNISGLPVTGIAEVDAANKKLFDQKTKDIKAAEDSFILNKASFEKNAGYYSNFDTTNTTFNNIMNERRNALSSSPDGTLSDQQAQVIANKYGITLDEVRNPNKVWDKLMPTEEGKQKLGVTSYENSLSDLTTNFERKKADAATSLKNAQANVDMQIADVQKQLQRNLDFMTASGAWSGAMKSSGYLTGIENVRKDGQETINKLNVMLDQAKTASAEDVSRLTQDYNNAITRAKTDLDTQMSELKQLAGSQMSAISEQYGIGSDKLTTALQEIEDNFHMKTLDSMQKYTENLRTINQLTNDNIDQSMKMQEFMDKKNVNRYNMYLANNGAALANSNFGSLSSDVLSGSLTKEAADILKASMVSSVVTTLTKNGATISPNEQLTIEHMLQGGATPSQVVARMSTLDKFKTVEKPTTIEMGGSLYQYDKATNSWKQAIAPKEQIVQIGGVPYKTDPNTGNLVRVTTVDTTMKNIPNSGVTITESGVVSFDQQSEAAAKNLGINTNLLKLEDGTNRGTQTLANGRERDLAQCGAYANDVLKKPGLFGDLLEDKVSVLNSKSPSVGSAVVFDVKGIPNGHVGIVVGVDEDAGVMWVKSSNAHGDREISTDMIPYKDSEGNLMPGVEGFYSPGGSIESKEPGAVDKALFDKALEGKLTETDREAINERGWTDEDINKYAESKKEATGDFTKFSPGDIEVYNSMTPTKKTEFQNDPKFQAFYNKKKEVMDSKDSSMNDILEYSRGGKEITQTEFTQLDKYNSALNQLSAITTEISKIDTGPILGRLRSLNPYDTSAQKLSAQLNALIPNLARGVYGEVGVLTDNDIRQYAKTIPSLTSTSDVNKAVLAMTLDTIAGGYKRKIATLAKAGYDVAGLTSTYEEIKSLADSTKAELF